MTTDELAVLVSGVLEETAFVFSHRAKQPPVHGTEPLIVTSLSLRGASISELELTASPALARLLIETLLDDLPSAEAIAAHCEDTMKEFLNVLGGKVAAELAQASSTRVAIGLPSARYESAADWEREFSTKALSATVVTEEGHRIDVAACP